MRKNKKKQHICILGMLMMSSMGMAQESLLFENSHSPLEVECQELGTRPELQIRNVVLTNPAMLRHGLDNRRSYFNDNPKTLASSHSLVVA